MPLFPSLFVSSFPLPHPQSRRDNLGFFGEEIGGSSNSPLSRCHRRTRTRLPDPRRSGCHCFVWPQSLYLPARQPVCLAYLVSCQISVGEGGRAPCHVIAIARCHLSSAPLFLLATPIFRDTIFSSQSPPSPPPLSSSSVRSYAVSPSKLLFILAPTKSLFSSLPSMRTCCCPSLRGSFCILLHYKSWASCPSGIFAFNPPSRLTRLARPF